MKRRLFLIARVVVTGGLIAYVLRAVGVGAVIQAFTQLQLGWFMAAELLLAGALIVASVRWGVLLLAQGCHYRVGRLLRLNFIASFYNVVLPGQESGNAVKAFMLGQSSGQASAIWASVVVDQLTLFLGLLLTGLLGLAAYGNLPGRSSWLAVIVGLLVGVTALTALMVSGLIDGPVRRLSARLRWGGEHREWLYPFWSAVGSYRQAAGHLLAGLALAIVYQLLVDVAIFALAVGLGLSVGYVQFIWVLCAVYIAQALPFTIAGLGVREATLVYFLAPLGVAGGNAVALSFTVVILYYAFAMPGAILQFAGDVPWLRRLSGPAERR